MPAGMTILAGTAGLQRIGRVMSIVGSADLSGVSGAPTFFINDRRRYQSYDVTTLAAEVRAARARAAATALQPTGALT